MALIECPECKGTVSSNAKSCTHCGYQVNPTWTQFTVSSFLWNLLKLFFYGTVGSLLFIFFLAILG